MEEKLLKGTTTVGIVCRDGVVLATETRATADGLVAHKRTEKLYKINDRLGMTVAGLVGDAQLLVRDMRAEYELYRFQREEEMSIKGAATLLSNILYQRRFYPYYVQLLIGGMDDEGPALYSLDPAGGAIPDKYVSTGSGSVMVYGVLEDRFKEDLSVQEGSELAVRGLKSAMERDSYSGGEIAVATITKDGFKMLSDSDLSKIISKIGKKVV
jgi:proteasome beta subunit